MYIPSNTYGSPKLGNNVSIIGNANFGSEPYLIKIGDNMLKDLTTIPSRCGNCNEKITLHAKNLENNIEYLDGKNKNFYVIIGSRDF